MTSGLHIRVYAHIYRCTLHTHVPTCTHTYTQMISCFDYSVNRNERWTSSDVPEISLCGAHKCSPRVAYTDVLQFNQLPKEAPVVSSSTVPLLWRQGGLQTVQGSPELIVELTVGISSRSHGERSPFPQASR